MALCARSARGWPGVDAGDLKLHTLVQRDLPRTFFPDTFINIGDRRAQRAGDLKQSSGRNAIDAALIAVFVR
jgi:hypothetical protein